jgi:MtrB/PioB family decaheme-associated outer membrane protein
MKTNKQLFALNPLALAVNGALVAMFAMPFAAVAADPAVTELTQPVNSVEIGAAYVTQKSAKFGEYNGLNKADGVVLGGFELNGGDAHNGSNGLTSWQLQGRDLGTTSRELKATVSKQGQWDLGLGYDELTHYSTDTYQTPYITAGANSFRLPTGFGTIANTNNGLTAAQQAAFHTVDSVGPSRKNTSLSAGYNISSRWDVKFDFNHLDQTGNKVTSVGQVGRKFATDVGTPGGEMVAYLTTPTNYTTDNLTLALNWAGDGSYATASYFSSTFKDAYNSYNFQTYSGANNIQTVSTAPSNTFEQINVSGGYKLGAKTKLSGGVSYGVNRQNEAFAVDSFMFVTPSVAPGNSQTSMDGLVESTHADLKLSDQSFANWSLSAGLKYDDRHNKSASNIYNAYAIDGGAGNVYNYPNRPLSTEKTQLELAADYRMSATRHLLLSYVNEDLHRFCSQYAVGGTNYPAGTNCVVAKRTQDDKLSAVYRVKTSDEVALTAGYAYDVRKTDSDVNAITPFLGVRGNDVGATTGTIKGLNGGDFRGFYPFFNASRTQQAVKGGVNWDANDKLTLGLSARYTDDKYDSRYGVQNGNSWSASLDAAYNYSDTASVTAYVSQQSRYRKMTDLQRSVAQGSSTLSTTAITVPGGATWSDRLSDDDLTIGIGSKKSGLLGGKLSIEGDLSYSYGTSKYETALNYSTATSGGVVCSDARILSCGALPTISNEIVSLKINGSYQKDKQTQIAIGYLFQQQVSNDYYFNALQSGYNPSQVLATNQKAPNYAVSVISATYTYTFH